jgi:hypothetical protein
MDLDREQRTSPISEQEPSPENLQARLDRLQELVCLLLAKNHTLRMALIAAGAGEPFDDPLSTTPQIFSSSAIPWPKQTQTGAIHCPWR